MIPTIVLPVVIGVLYAAGVYLLLDRSLTRVVLGFVLLGNATNVLLLSTSGPSGAPPIVGEAAPEEMSDPLPQALILTAIVITFGVTAFLLAIVYRSWRLVRQEVVVADEEDRRVAAGSGTDADEVDPGELAPEDRPAGHADTRSGRAGDADGDPEGADLDALLSRHYAGFASDDVGLPPAQGGPR